MDLDSAPVLGLEDAFEGAAVYVQTSLPSSGSAVSNEAKLQLYALYKQATEGDAPVQGPGLQVFDQKGKHKWRAAALDVGLALSEPTCWSAAANLL